MTTDVLEASTISPTGSQAQTFLALLARDLRVLRREAAMFFARTVMQPLFFVFVFAYVLPKIGPGGGSPFASAAPAGVSFSTILVPGLVAQKLREKMDPAHKFEIAAQADRKSPQSKPRSTKRKT